MFYLLLFTLFIDIFYFIYHYLLMFYPVFLQMVSIPILQGFGLIFKDRFEDLKFSATQVTLIINCNSFFGMILGIFNGPLITIFGYRKTAVLGTLIFTSGVVYTAFASSFIHFIISYGMITCKWWEIILKYYLFSTKKYFNYLFFCYFTFLDIFEYFYQINTMCWRIP